MARYILLANSLTTSGGNIMSLKILMSIGPRVISGNIIRIKDHYTVLVVNFSFFFVL